MIAPFIAPPLEPRYSVLISSPSSEYKELNLRVTHVVVPSIVSPPGVVFQVGSSTAVVPAVLQYKYKPIGRFSVNTVSPT